MNHDRVTATVLLPTLALLLALLPAIQGCQSSLSLRNQGDRAYAAGEYAQAAELYDASLQRDPTDATALYRLGLAQLEAGRPGEAQVNLERAWGLRPGSKITPNILDALAEAIYQQDHPERLDRFLQQQAKRYGTTRAYLRQAKYLTLAGDIDLAQVALQKAIRFADEDDPRPYLALADFYSAVNDVPQAIQALRWAAYVAPESERVARRLRELGVTPGPTAAQQPPAPDDVLK
ncbi:MAG: tetratricopeptide repeat protein [Phycisphaeraceae bacterium]